MTGREWLNAMSDEALAVFISKLMSQHRAEMIKALRQKGLIPANVEFIEMPAMSATVYLKFLKEPIGGKK